jgi:wobble nucleotide-excising tRNase
MAGIAKQVIVLSHDPSFLKDLRDSSTSATVKSLRVKRSSTTYTVSEFDIEQHCLPQAQRDFFVLTSFIEDGLPDGSDLGTVARSIRPFVENSIRSRFPELPGGIMLGDIITRARESKATEPIAALKKDLLDLEGINDYSKRFHHPSNETPNDQELRTFAQRAIQLNRGS